MRWQRNDGHEPPHADRRLGGGAGRDTSLARLLRHVPTGRDERPSLAARFVATFGGSGLLLEEGGATGRAVSGFAVNGSGTNADGTTFRWHENGRTVFDATGTPKLDLFHQTATCS